LWTISARCWRALWPLPARFGGAPIPTLDPDVVAETAWDLYTKRDRAEAVFNTLT
jgi:hypothetical protein